MLRNPLGQAFLNSAAGAGGAGAVAVVATAGVVKGARVVAAAILLLALAAGVGAAAREQANFKTGRLTIHAEGRKVDYQVEVADNNRLRRLGLMHRQSLPENQGMLLLFAQPQRASIWMKNTFIPLDLLYIDDQGRIVKIVENAIPRSTGAMRSNGKVKAVLELNAGQVSKWGLAVGDRVSHSAR